MNATKFSIAVDTGGTFTDCIAIDQNGQISTCKVLSNSSLRGSIVEWIDARTFYVQNNWQVERDIFPRYFFNLLSEAPLSISGFLRVDFYDFEKKILRIDRNLPAELIGKKLAFAISGMEEAPILAARLITQTALREPLNHVDFRLGTTRGTNALLERKGARTAFLTTEGLGDILKIGNQQRPDLFALNIVKSEPLYTEGVEIEERLDANGNLIKSLTLNNLGKIITQLKKAKIESVAIALMHSYRNPEHELALKNILENHFDCVSISSELSRQIKFVPRATTTVVNAYLEPILNQYLNNIEARLSDISYVMTSGGNLIGSPFFKAKDSLLSGPAGGVVGAAVIAKASGFDKIITFDMGGTSTDVARFDGDFDRSFETTIGNATVFAPALTIETVAAGGGSICRFDGAKLVVGPESAGASPGPACYGAGGDLTITDVNLLLGRLDASQFSIPIFPEKAEQKLNELLSEIELKTGQKTDKELILNGFRQIANERMAEAIRKISVAKGYAPPQYALLVFGGAGGLHACSLARLLGMKTVVIPKFAGLLSAFGILQAQIERMAERQILATIDQISTEELAENFQDLENEAVKKLTAEGIDQTHISIKKRLIFCRFKGQDMALELEYNSVFSQKNQTNSNHNTQHKTRNTPQYLVDFEKKYRQTFGHWVENRPIEIESIRVIAAENPKNQAQKNSKLKTQNPKSPPQYRHKITALVGENWQEVPVFFRDDLQIGATISGFALLLDSYATTVIEQDFSLTIDENETAILTQIEIDSTKSPSATHDTQHTTHSQTIDLELFTNRFAAIAETMGALLQRTSLSVNVKERLDFSCALLDTEGYLIANAPHIPVHLGSLGVCVREVVKHLPPLESGDVIVTNHPAFGGSHLPDVTVISPVFESYQQSAISSQQDKIQNPKSKIRLIGYMANRCHHAEIGGIRPASMPPNATLLVEEGVIIEPTYLARRGVVDWETIGQKLQNACYPTRSLAENLADLNAALAANLAGVEALQNLVLVHGFEKVVFYQKALKDYSAQRLAVVLANKFQSKKFLAEELMDDGTILKVAISIDNQQVTFDFTGSSPTHKGNLNATPAIVQSVVIYILRLILGENIPLNEGFMQNVELILPEGSILNPNFSKNTEGGNFELKIKNEELKTDFDATKITQHTTHNTQHIIQNPAVVGGNVETSQRLTDTILKAFGILACGQGTMNNVLFGNANFGYYETICGGAGAGDGFKGADAVHTHMTNTRITDPEILELRYPVRLDTFKIREKSGGKGKFTGGNGIIRRLTFLDNIELSVLTQHRKVRPFGMDGGGAGKLGRQFIIRKNGTIDVLKNVDGASLAAGDSFVVETPGGGGFGSV